jgi:hypothetical protein
LNASDQSGIHYTVRRLKTILTVLLAVLWLPVTSHCLLFESGTDSSFLSCCTHTDDASTEAEHHQDECATDPCSIIEGAQYKSSLQRLTVPPFVAQIVFQLPAPLDASLLLPRIVLRPSDDALSRLPVAWQFSARTALPPRAPSFVS